MIAAITPLLYCRFDYFRHYFSPFDFVDAAFIFIFARHITLRWLPFSR
jgi:hypothetical protein